MVNFTKIPSFYQKYHGFLKISSFHTNKPQNKNKICKRTLHTQKKTEILTLTKIFTTEKNQNIFFSCQIVQRMCSISKCTDNLLCTSHFVAFNHISVSNSECCCRSFINVYFFFVPTRKHRLNIYNDNKWSEWNENSVELKLLNTSKNKNCQRLCVECWQLTVTAHQRRALILSLSPILCALVSVCVLVVFLHAVHLIWHSVPSALYFHFLLLLLHWNSTVLFIFPYISRHCSFLVHSFGCLRRYYHLELSFCMSVSFFFSFCPSCCVCFCCCRVFKLVFVCRAFVSVALIL